MDEFHDPKSKSNSAGAAQDPDSITRHHPPATSPFRHVPIRVVVFSAILLPVVLMPYLLTVRRTLMLRRKVDELHKTTHALRQELDTALAKLSARKTEAQYMKATLTNVVMDTDAVQHRVADLVAENNASRRDFDMLVGESQHSRAQRAALKALGSSLADVAAFMHEMELQIGIQPLSTDAQRRVDRLRIAALRLQNLGTPRQPTSDAAGVEHPGATPADNT